MVAEDRLKAERRQLKPASSFPHVTVREGGREGGRGGGGKEGGDSHTKLHGV